MKGFLPGVALAALALGVIGSARAQEGERQDSWPERLARTELLTPPAVQSRVAATYPTEALPERVSATVGLEVAIDEGGAVTSARVTAPAGRAFDEAALEAVKKFVFAPARRNGQPIKSTLPLSYEFHPSAERAPSTAPAPAGPPPAILPQVTVPPLQQGPTPGPTAGSRDRPRLPSSSSPRSTIRAGRSFIFCSSGWAPPSG